MCCLFCLRVWLHDWGVRLCSVWVSQFGFGLGGRVDRFGVWLVCCAGGMWCTDLWVIMLIGERLESACPTVASGEYLCVCLCGRVIFVCVVFCVGSAVIPYIILCVCCVNM